MFKLTRIAIRRNKDLMPTCFIVSKNNEDANPKSARPMAKKVEKMKKYGLSKYLDYLKNYDQSLKKTFPRMMHIYEMISCGTQNFYGDLKSYLVVRKKERQQGVDSLSSQELQIAHTLPRDLMKISPTLVALAIPFTNYILFPLVYFFPRKILTHHYWSDAQKDDFTQLDHTERSKHKTLVFQIMQVQAQKSKHLPEAWGNVIIKLKNKQRPLTSEILNCQDLFLDVPFSLKSMKRNHVVQKANIVFSHI